MRVTRAQAQSSGTPANELPSRPWWSSEAKANWASWMRRSSLICCDFHVPGVMLMTVRTYHSRTSTKRHEPQFAGEEE